jgi:hypothetical protein
VTILTVSKEEIEVLFKQMMSDLEGFTQIDEIYQEDMKDFVDFYIHFPIYSYCFY